MEINRSMILSLTKSLLNFSHPDNQEATRCSLAELVKTALHPRDSGRAFSSPTTTRSTQE